MNALRVLHAYKIFRPDVEGGIPEVISSLTRAAPAGIASSVVVARSKGFGRSYEVDGVPVTAAGSIGTLLSMPMAPGYVQALNSRLGSTDVVVHHAPFPLNDLALLAIPASTSLIVHWHAEIVGRNFFKSLLTPAFNHSLRRADAIIVSHETMIAHSPFLRPFANKCVAIPYGADLDYWGMTEPSHANEVERLRADFGPLIVAIGRLVPYKGFSVLLQAMQGLAAQLVIVGDGPLLKDLQNQAQQLGITHQVRFAGRLPQEEVRRLVHASVALAMPSVSVAEAFGIVQIEAMAAGRPVVNTDLPTAVPYIARNGQEGLTARIGDVNSLRDCLRAILTDDALAARLGTAGRSRAHSEYSLENFRARNFDVYRAAVQRRRLGHVA